MTSEEKALEILEMKFQNTLVRPLSTAQIELVLEAMEEHTTNCVRQVRVELSEENEKETLRLSAEVALEIVVEERNELEKERDAWHAAAEEWKRYADKLQQQHTKVMNNKEYYIKSLELQVELFKGRLDEAQAAFDELEGILMGVENIFAGWSNDECWTDYDEKVRQQILEFRKKHTYKDVPHNAVGVEKPSQKINTNLDAA